MVSVGQHWCQCHVNGEGTGKTGQQTVLYNFTNGTDGANPVGSAQGLSEPAKNRRGRWPHIYYQVTRMSLEVPPAAGT